MTGIYALGPLCCFAASRLHARLTFRMGVVYNYCTLGSYSSFMHGSNLLGGLDTPSTSRFQTTDGGAAEWPFKFYMKVNGLRKSIEPKK